MHLALDVGSGVWGNIRWGLMVWSGDQVVGEDLEASTAAGFCAIHGGVDTLEQGLGIDRLAGDCANADAGRDGEF